MIYKKDSRVKNIRYIVCFFLLIINSNNIDASVNKIFETPERYLLKCKTAMEYYKKIYGHYANSIEELDQLFKYDLEFIDSKKKEYEYIVRITSEKSYHIKTKNNKGLRDCEIKKGQSYATWIFLNSNDRMEAKKEVLDIIEGATPYEKRSCIGYLKHFNDKETKQYLITIIKDNNEDQTVRDNACDTLEFLVNKTDIDIVADLLQILNSKNYSSSTRMNIIKIFGKIKDHTPLPTLKKIVETEQDYPACPIKSLAKRSILKIESPYIEDRDEAEETVDSFIMDMEEKGIIFGEGRKQGADNDHKIMIPETDREQP